MPPSTTLLLRYFYILLVIALCNGFDVLGKYYFAGDSGSYSVTYDPYNPDRAWVAGISNGSYNENNAPYGKGDGFYMEISLSDLSVQWLFYIGSTEDDFIMDTAVNYIDGTPILYLAGKSDGDFYNLTNSGSSTNDAFLTAINTSDPSIPLWTVLEGNGLDQNTSSVSVDAVGNIYLAGDTLFGFNGQPYIGQLDGFIIKYNSSGVRLWTRVIGTVQDDSCRGIATDPSNTTQGVFIVGTSDGNFGGNPNFGGLDFLVALYSADGDLVWSTLLGNAGDDFGWAITLDNTGAMLFATGSMSLNFATVGIDASNGNHTWLNIEGSTSFIEVGFAIATSASENNVCAGGDTRNGALCLVVCYDFYGKFLLNSTYGSDDGLQHLADLKGDLWNGSLLAVGTSTGNFYGNTPTAFNNAYIVKLTMTKDDESNNEVKVAVAIIASVCSVVGLLLLGGVGGGFFAVWYLRRKNRRRMAAEFALETASPSKASRNKAISAEHSKYIIPYSELRMGTQLGSGNFGIVHIGHWRSQTVAIKEIKKDFGEDSKELQDFLNEAVVMMSMKPHKNITTLYAVCLSPLLIITEYVENGSLDRFIDNKRLSFEQVLQILKDIAAGMHHLAAEGIVHKDLGKNFPENILILQAARNVLISRDGTAKIADFGLARNYDESSSTEKEKGPLRWMSPEALSKREFSEKSDVWSFAATTVEMLTGKFPYSGTNIAVVVKQVKAGLLKPELPETVQLREGEVEVPQELIALIGKCTQFEPADRPTFVEITQKLREISPESHPLTRTQLSPPVMDNAPQSTTSEYNNLKARKTQEDTYNTQAEYKEL